MAWFTNPFIVGVLGSAGGALYKKNRVLGAAVGGVVESIGGYFAYVQSHTSISAWDYAKKAATAKGFVAVKTATGIKSLQTAVLPYEGAFSCGYAYSFVDYDVTLKAPAINVYKMPSCYGGFVQNYVFVASLPVYTQAQINALPATTQKV